MKNITIEEHFFTDEYIEYLRSREEPPKRRVIEAANHNKIERSWDSAYFRDRPLTVTMRHLDTGEGRLVEMDRAGIDMQVLSLGSPGVEVFDAVNGQLMASKTNNELARIIEKYPERFSGFASLAPQDPNGAVAELERAVRELGLKGASINSHINGQYLDDKKFWGIWQKAEELDVPIYLHPREPSPDMVKPYSTYPILLGSVEKGTFLSPPCEIIYLII